MARKNFKITSSEGLEITKHAWNSSIRAIEANVREIARSEKTTYNLIDSCSIRSDPWHFCEGTRTWASSDKTIVYIIKEIL